MKINGSLLYSPCPCGSEKKFKFCCWPKYRDLIDSDMTYAEIIQSVRCEEADAYRKSESSEADDLCDRGDDEFHDGNFDKARELFKKARELDPKIWIAFNNEAVCALNERDVEAAYDIQKKGIEVCPIRNTFGAASMAIYSYILGRKDEAVEWTEKAFADKIPLSRDVVIQVCKALALFKRHKDILDYTETSRMDEDGNVSFFKGTALANLGKKSKAITAFKNVDSLAFDDMAADYIMYLREDGYPPSPFGDFPYFAPLNFEPARWFDKDMSSGRDPFAKYPAAAAISIEILVAQELRTPDEMLRLTEDREGDDFEMLRNELKTLADCFMKFKRKSPRPDGPLSDGITEEEDPMSSLTLHRTSVWRMTYTPSEEMDPSEDAETVIEKFIRPYTEKHCSLSKLDDPDKLEIAVLVNSHSANYPETCPTVKTGKYRQLWDILHEELEDYFSSACIKPIACELKYDQMFGGPILTFDEGDGNFEKFMIAAPDPFDL